MCRDGSLTMTQRDDGPSRSRPRGTALIRLALLASLCLLIGDGHAQAQDKRSQTWLTDDGDTRVRIGPCGQEICGTVVWQRVPYNDAKNPDPAKRARPIVGIRMISHIQPTGPDSWTGELYSFDDGFTVKGSATRIGADKLKLSGCVLGGLICRTVIWTRVNR